MSLDFRKLSDPDYRKELLERVEQLKQQVAKEANDYDIFLVDALSSPRTNEWELNFLHNLRGQQMRDQITRKADLSAKQRNVVNKIEEKIYAAG